MRLVERADIPEQVDGESGHRQDVQPAECRRKADLKSTRRLRGSRGRVRDTDPQRGDIMSWLRYGMNPDLRQYRKQGGKILMYHGWDDNEVAAGASVDYYETATKTMGGEAETQKFFRLFMIPGMGHCRRGPGGDAADFMSALERWDEQGIAPDAMVMHHLVKEQNYLGLPRPIYPLAAGSFDRTRPVFPFPDAARYSGKGDPAKAENWVKAARAAGQ